MSIRKFSKCLTACSAFFLVACASNNKEPVVTYIAPESISFTFSNDNVEAGELVTIEDVKVYPEDATNKEVVYLLDSYANENSIATLSGNSIATVKEGQVTVTVQSVDNPKVKTEKTLNVLPISVKSASLSLSNNEVTVGDTVIATVDLLPNTAKITTYSIYADPNKAFVDGNKITPLVPGDIEIYAKTKSGITSNTVTLVSNEQLKSRRLKASASSTHLYAGEEVDVSAYIGSKAVDATYTTLTGTDNVVKVDGNTITAVNPGREVIRAYYDEDTTVALLSITVEDDMLISSTPISATLKHEILTDEDVPTMLGDGHDSVLALTTEGDKANYPSYQFCLPHPVDTTKYSLSVDVFSDLAYPWSSIMAYDSNFNLVGKEIGKDYVNHQWTRFDVPFISTDICYLRFTVNYEKAGGVDSSIYFDSLNLRKGSTFAKGLELNENSKDYRMPCYDLTEFSENQLYLEVKADGTGDDIITFQDTVTTSGAWYNITGNVKFSFTDGVLTSASGYQIATLDDGWYGVYIPFKGDGADRAMHLNLLYSGNKIGTDLFYIDLKNITPAIGTYVEKGATLQVSSNAGNFDYIPYEKILDKGAFTEIKVRAKGDGTIKFAYMDKTWENISGTITIVVSNDIITKVYTGSGAADKVGEVEALGDGWFAVRLTESQMQYPGGQSGTAAGFGLIYGGNSCTCDYYELDNHSFKVTYGQEIVDPEGEDIYDEGC